MRCKHRRFDQVTRRYRTLFSSTSYILLPLTVAAWLMLDPLAVDLFRLGMDRSMLAAPFDTVDRLIAGVGIVRLLAVSACVIAMFFLLGMDFVRAISRRGPRLTVGRLLVITSAFALWSGILVNTEPIAWLG